MTNAWAMRPLLPASVTASSTAAGYAAANMLNDYAGVVWKSTAGSATQQILIDLGSGAASIVDAVLLFGCTAASGSWTLQVQGADSADMATNFWEGGAVTFLAGATMPTHARGVGYWTASTTPPARRYWLLTIASLASAAVTVARLAVGGRLTLERNFEFGGAFGVRDLGSMDWSANGVPLRRRAAKLRTIGISFPNVRKDEVLAKVQPLIELQAGQEPIVLVTDPAVSADRQLHCWCGWMVGEMGTVWRAAHAWVWRVNLIDMIPIPKAG